MGWLSRRAAFVVLSVLALIDGTTLVREAGSVLWSVGTGLAGATVLVDAWLLWGLAMTHRADRRHAVQE